MPAASSCRGRVDRSKLVALAAARFTLKLREPSGLGAELLCPLLLFVGLVLVFTLSANTTSAAMQFSNTAPATLGVYSSQLSSIAMRVAPVSSLPFHLQANNMVLAVAPRDAGNAAQSAAVDSLVSFIQQQYPAFNGSAAGTGGFSSPSLRAWQVPALGAVVSRFNSEADVEAFVQSAGYESSTKVWAAITINSGLPAVDYAIRCNQSLVVDTQLVPVNVVDAAFQSAYTYMYLWASPTFLTIFDRQPADEVLGRGFPGFVTLQLLLDRWAINSTARGGFEALDTATVVGAVLGVSGSMLSTSAVVALQTELAAMQAAVISTAATASAAVANYTAAVAAGAPAQVAAAAAAAAAASAAFSAANASWAAMAGSLKGFLRAEALAPQQVDLVPFPVPAYASNPFFASVASVLGVFLVLCFVLPAVRLVRCLVLDKETRRAEALSMMGVGAFTQYLSWAAFYVALALVQAAAVAGMGSTTIFAHSDKGLIFVAFALLGLATIPLCYVISAFFAQARTAAVVGALLYFMTLFPYFSVSGVSGQSASKTAACLLPASAFMLIFDAITMLEDAGVGLQVSNLWTEVSSFRVAAGLLMMCVDAVWLTALGAYAEAVMPAGLRGFGTPAPWYFPCTARFWLRTGAACAASCGCAAAALPTSSAVPAPEAELKWDQRLRGGHTRMMKALRHGSTRLRVATARSSRHLLALTCCCGGRCSADADDAAAAHGAWRHGRGDAEPVADASAFEPPTAATEELRKQRRCIELADVRKTFPSTAGGPPFAAVRGVTTTLFENQIYVLLGHNGAGKSVTISMICGLYEATEGAITIRGNTLPGGLPAARAQLGVCPQQNVLWPSLTVAEHADLICALKGVPREDAEVDKLLSSIGLGHKKHARAGTLSGGQQRKVCVILALVGGSKVILLDEPTAGMDPYSRRSTWKLLRQAREGRVMLLTTHDMMEADVLGDRVGIMSRGRLQCCGSPLFLKARYGIGYVLTCLRASSAKPGSAGDEADPLLLAVRQHVPAAVCSAAAGSELLFRLPLEASAVFPIMLRELEARSAQLGLVEIGISVTTLLDVFASVAAQADDASALPQKQQQPCSETASAAPPESAVAVKEAARASASSKLPDTATADAAGKEQGLLLVAGTGSNRWEQMQALMWKRAMYARRDLRGLLCLLGLPVLIFVIGMGVIVSSNSVTRPSYQFTTAVFNVDSQQSSWYGPTAPNVVPAFSFKSTASARSGGSVTANATASVSALLAQFAAPNVSMPASFVFDTPATAAFADTASFVNANASCPTQDLERMSAYLLSSRTSHAESRYGAFVLTLDGTILPGQSNRVDIGGASSENAATYAAFFNATCIHGALTMMNLVNSALLRSVLGVNSSSPQSAGSITARTQPLPLSLQERRLLSTTQSAEAVFVLALALVFVPASFVVFVVKERESGAKHQQLLAGVELPTYWLSLFLWDIGSYWVMAALVLAATAAFNVAQLTASVLHVLPAYVALLVLAGPAFAVYSYVLSFAFSTHSSAQNGLVGISVACLLAVILVDMVISTLPSSSCRIGQTVPYILRVLPPYAMYEGLFRLIWLAVLPTRAVYCDLYNGASVDLSAAVAPYDAFDVLAAGGPIAYLGGSIVVYAVIALLLDTSAQTPALMQMLSSALRCLRHCCSGRCRVSAVSSALPPRIAAEAAARVASGHAADAAAAAAAAATAADDDDVLCEAVRVQAQADGLAAGDLCAVSTSRAVLPKIRRAFTRRVTQGKIERRQNNRRRSDLPVESPPEQLPGTGQNAPSRTGATGAQYDGPNSINASGNAQAVVGGGAGEIVAAAAPRLASLVPPLVAVPSPLTQHGLGSPQASGLGSIVAVPSPRAAFSVHFTAAPLSLAPQASLDTLVLHHVHKAYNTGPLDIGKKPLVAVVDLTVGVSSGEVFGLLGVNGAGKSTTLSMIGGDVLPTRGAVFVGGHDTVWDAAAARRCIGYCPQTDPLLDLLTPREHLDYFAALKGVPRHLRARAVDSLVSVLQLGVYQHTASHVLSGGCKRKVSLGCAVIGAPRLVLIDEGSTGMDPLAKREMWAVISELSRTPILAGGATPSAGAAASERPAIVVTSHAMEEIEALCSRVGIIRAGRMLCLGSIPHLKDKFNQGFELMIRVKLPTPSVVDELTRVIMSALEAPAAAGPQMPPPGGAATSDSRIPTNNLEAVCALLHCPSRFHEITEHGTGWIVAAELARSSSATAAGATNNASGAPVAALSVPAHVFAAWWLEEEAVATCTAFICGFEPAPLPDACIDVKPELSAAVQVAPQPQPRLQQLAAFPGATVVERNGPEIAFRLPLRNVSTGSTGSSGGLLADAFDIIECGRVQACIESYALGQTSLEMLFNQLATGS